MRGRRNGGGRGKGDMAINYIYSNDTHLGHDNEISIKIILKAGNVFPLVTGRLPVKYWFPIW
jgi:hypothetical protein